MSALAPGQRVRVKRSGKTGVVTALGKREEAGHMTVAALVLLDPFVARWSDCRPSCVVALEGIYGADDLEALCPTR